MARLRRWMLVPLLVIAPAFWNGCRTNQARVAPTAPIPDEAQQIENTTARDRWFLFQRMYPFNSIPTEARRKAWKALQKAAALNPLDVSNPWNPAGPAPTSPPYDSNGLTSGRINSIAVSPANPQLILIGAADGGIWRSTDRGSTFVPVADDQVDLAVGSIDFSSSDPSTVYAGMGDPYAGLLGTGVLKSTDSGTTWSRVDNGSLPQPGTVSKIKVDPTDSNRVYLAQFSDLNNGAVHASGFYISTDGGVNWTQTLAGLSTDIAINPTHPQILYVGAGQGAATGGIKPAGLYRSTDSGLTWSSLSRTPSDGTAAVKVAVSSDGQTIYGYSGESVGNAFEIQLKASTDGGATWNNRSTAGLDSAQFTYDSYVAVDPANARTVYIGARDVFRSKDGGSTWTNLTQTFSLMNGSFVFSPATGLSHTDQHALAFAPDGSGRFYIGNDGGIWTSSGAPLGGSGAFVSLNSSLQLTQFYTLTIHPTDPTLSYGGAQDNGVQKRVQGSNDWVQLVEGDGGHCILNPSNPSTVFATVQFGSVFRYLNGGAVFDKSIGSNSTFGEPDTNARIAFIAPFANDGADSTLYFGTWRLFASTDLGDTWTATAGTTDLTRGGSGATGDVLTAIGVGPANPSVIYTGSSFGRAMVSSDGGKTWTDISAGLPNRFITSIEVNPKDSSTAYLTVSGFGSGHVFETSDGGATWFDVSGNLPDLPVNAVLIDSKNPGSIYVGDDIGVFHSTYGGMIWEAFNSGLPPAVANALAIHRSGLIQVGTFGRGAFQTQSAPASSPDFQLFVTPATASVSRPHTLPVQAFVGRAGGFNGKLTLTVSGLSDPNIKLKPASISSSRDGGIFRLKIKAAAATGNQTLTFQATDQSGNVRTATLQVTIQ